MKILVSTIVCSLLITMSSLAQSPLADTIPQLKEWWRADDKMYGKDGMTWLDNFYHGKGVLVVSTPSGVQSWQLRFPGDTENVFTWSGGSAAIRTGDFNGDGITDYLDGKGYIYEGTQNGEPPKLQPATGKGFYPDLVMDINGDGYDDMFYPGGYVLGSANLQELESKVIKFKEIDSNNVALLSYKVSNEIRILCRHYYWTNLTKFPFGRVYKEGLRLIGLRWEGSGFTSKVLDEFTVSTLDSTGILYTGRLLTHPSGKHYFLCATMIKGNNQNTDVTVYDINNDKLEKLYSKRIDGIASINQLRKSIDGSEIPSCYINQYKLGVPTLHFYNGNIVDSLHEVAQFTTVQIASFTSISDINGDGRADAALSNHYFPSLEKFRFSILSLKDTSTGVEESPNAKQELTIESISPMPVSKDQIIQVAINVPETGKYSLSLFDSSGKESLGKTGVFHMTGKQQLPIDLSSYMVSSGMYFLRIEGDNSIAQCSILIR